MDGFVSLEQIAGGLYVGHNEMLQEFGDWPALDRIGGDVTVWQNPQLLAPIKQLVGGGGKHFALRSVGGSLSVEDNRRLQSFAGLASLTSIDGSLYVLRNDALLNLESGMSALASVGGDMYVQGGFESYSGLDALTSVGGSLVIHSLYDLLSLDGLQALQSVGENLVVHMCPQLESLSELSSLQSVGKRVEVYANPRLDRIDGMLAALQSIGSFATIDFINGTIDCPSGTGLLVDELPLIHDTTVDPLFEKSATTQPFGNWCTFNCKYPRLVVSGSPQGRMWQCRENDMWDAAWAPQCLPV
jgi:hypothetical protein